MQEAADAFSPSIVAGYAYDLAKEFNQYYHDTQILREEDARLRAARLHLCAVVAAVLRKELDLLGIELPERM